MRKLLLEHLDKAGISEDEFVRRVTRSGYDPGDRTGDVVAGTISPCELFFPIAEEILDLSEEDATTLLMSARQDARARVRAYKN